jgi:putative glutamine amidotransferase
MELGKPVIGITVDAKRDDSNARTGGTLTLNWNYAQAVSEAGGVPILIPPTSDMRQLAQLIDGWLIPGGNDIDAKHFGQENHPSVKLIEEDRFEAETRLFDAIDSTMPVFGICYGCQRVNVRRGGSLNQHIPDVEGSEEHTGGVMQSYAVDRGSRLAETIASDSIEGKSYHHQSIRDLGADISVSARHADGTIEAIEDPRHPWMVGVQWHPERTMDDPKTRKIFTDFVKAAAEFRASRLKQHEAVG